MHCAKVIWISESLYFWMIVFSNDHQLIRGSSTRHGPFHKNIQKKENTTKTSPYSHSIHLWLTEPPQHFGPVRLRQPPQSAPAHMLVAQSRIWISAASLYCAGRAAHSELQQEEIEQEQQINGAWIWDIWSGTNRLSVDLISHTHLPKK